MAHENQIEIRRVNMFQIYTVGKDNIPEPMEYKKYSTREKAEERMCELNEDYSVYMFIREL